MPKYHTQSDLLFFYATTEAIYIINMHCFRAVVEIPCIVKSQQSLKLRILDYVFLRFFEMPLQKNVKSRVFFNFPKKRKKTYSRTMVFSCMCHQISE